MLRLIKCEFCKMKRKPLVYISLLLALLIPVSDALFFLKATNDTDAVNNLISSLIQLGANLLLMPYLVIMAAKLLFEELDYDTLKNLLTVPVGRAKLVLAKMLVLLLFALGFMALGALSDLVIVLVCGWQPVGFWPLFALGLEVGGIMWAGALPCVLLLVLLNKNYIVSVVITFFYTIVNYIASLSDFFIMQPFGLNPGTLLPGPLVMRWSFQFYDHSGAGAEMAALLERISPYFLSAGQVLAVAAAESAVFLVLIVLAYRRQEV